MARNSKRYEGAADRALIVKCAPPAIGFDGVFEVAVRPVGDLGTVEGSEVFVWTSEGARGQGLAIHGTVEAARISLVNRKASLRIRVDALAEPGSLTFDDLRPHRDSEASGPLPKLARQLLRNAANKVAALDADEARLLRSYFKPAPAAAGPGAKERRAKDRAPVRRPARRR